MTPVIKNRTEILATWKRLRDLNEQAEATAMDLFAHPDATPEDIAKVREQVIEHRKNITLGWKQMEKLFQAQYVQPLPPKFILNRRARAQRELADKLSATSVSPVDTTDEIAAYGKER